MNEWAATVVPSIELNSQTPLGAVGNLFNILDHDVSTLGGHVE